MERHDLHELIDAGDAVAETRGPSIPGRPDTDHVLNFLVGLSDED